VYVEVLECDNVTTAPLPSKLLDTAMIRCARSEDDLAVCYDSANRSPRTAESVVCNDTPLMEYDESEGWTLEDDDIIQVNLLLIKLNCLNLSADSSFSETHPQSYRLSDAIWENTWC